MVRDDSSSNMPSLLEPAMAQVRKRLGPFSFVPRRSGMANLSIVSASKASEYRIEPLGPNHDRSAFCCGVPELDAYLQRQAGQDQKRKLAAVFIAPRKANRCPDSIPSRPSRSWPRICRLNSERGCRGFRCRLRCWAHGRRSITAWTGLGEFLLWTH